MNKRQMGAAYRANTLLLLAATGYASTRHVARFVWGRCDESSRRMASRTLRWLLERRLIVSRREGDGIAMANQELLFALTQAGADEVRKIGSSLVAKKVHARDYLRHAHAHRTACNGVYVAWPTPSVWSELEVRAGESPLSKFSYVLDGNEFGKIPDLVASGGDGFEWIEVENTWRSEKDLSKVVACMRQMFSRSSDLRITRMHFIVTGSSAKTIGDRLKKRLTHGPESGWPRQVKELDARILAQHLRVSTLDQEALQLRALWG
ncbi:hypothetical protein [Delftia acidovorans]|uniref:hypothetical protein n=1 Tax=Delftia acidovorans TaxID=80866 RepID=UPI0028AA6FCC|nr:hypothetical protein [Delftia acidovorans]